MKKITLSLCILAVATLSAQIHIGPGYTHTNILSAIAIAQPGDTIYLHAGQYAGYQNPTDIKGAKNNPIVITRYKDEHHEIKGGWQFSSVEHIRFEKLNFQGDANYPTGFINVDNSGDCNKFSKHITFDSCYFKDVTGGGNTFKFGGVDSFEISNCIFINNTGALAGAGVALNLSHYGVIKGCYFENIGQKAIQTKVGSSHVLIEKNFILNCGNDMAALKLGEAGADYCNNTTLSDHIKVYSNIIVGGKAAISIGQGSNTDIFNNTIINPSTWVTRVLNDDSRYPCVNINYKNNIFYLTASRYFNGSPGGGSTNIDYTTHTYENNLFYYTPDPSWSPNPTGGPYDMEEIAGTVLTGNITGNPNFVNAGTHNYRLQAGSAAIGAGLSLSEPAVDYYGHLYKNPRCIGAAEYNSSPASVKLISKTIHQNDFVCFPNPANGGVITIASYNAELGKNINLIEVMDLTGRVVESVQPQQLPASLQINTLKKGVYFIRLSGEHYSNTQRLLIN